ncbi:hypothetical protein FZ084_14880 [Listeria monocytogenes]|uniref:hypothetical protein n=1 Tax=Listeria monocytogenes TaxID=1639 RepID=UPI0010B4840F|nr:hypothetical protein [Listeria monocytogenes]EAC4737183.1 hypothetical protein [Listeria monocytogenes]TYW25170.1 hypothetical protein FZ084_14880 [Listeria monocytogenes]
MVQKHINFREVEKTPFGIAYLEKQSERFHSKPSRTVEKIFEEHAKLLEEKESTLLNERMKKDIGLIRLRTGYADKNTQILIELLNTLIFHIGVPHAVLTTVQSTTPYLESKQKVEDMIKANMEKKAGKDKPEEKTLATPPN